MLKDLMDRVKWILEQEESFIVSVERVWGMLEDRFGPSRIDYEDFIHRLEDDSRFRIIRDSGAKEKEEDSALRVLNQHITAFTGGTRVMLKERIPTRKEVVSFLLKKADTTFDTLKKAWDVRPTDDETMEDQLLQALAKTQRLQRELRAILTRDKA